jgi:chromosome segregation ATPase
MLRTRNEEYQRIYTELESFKKMAQQKIQSSEGEFTTLQKNYTVVSQEYDNAKKHLQEYEVSIRKLYNEFERLQGIINELKKERQSLFDKVSFIIFRTTFFRKKLTD